MLAKIKIGEKKIDLEYYLEKILLEGGRPYMLAPGAWFALVDSGRLELRARRLCEYGPVTGRPGTLFFLPLTSAISISSSEGCALSCLRLAPLCLQSLVSLLPVPQGRELPEGIFQEGFAIALRDTTARDFRRALAEARALAVAGGNGFSAALDEGRLALRLEEAALLAARELLSRSDLSAGGVWGVEDAARYVAEHCQEEFRLADLVSKCATNPGDFCRRFKELTGSPLFEFINRERVRRACELLKRTDTPITEIALSVGYKNIGFFNRYFLRVTGMNPSDFRKKV